MARPVLSGAILASIAILALPVAAQSAGGLVRRQADQDPDRVSRRPDSATTPMAGSWRGISANIFRAIRSSCRRTGRGAGLAQSGELSLQRGTQGRHRDRDRGGAGVAMEPLLGGSASQAKFDSTKFAWLGSMNNEVSGFFIRQPGPVTTLQQVLAGTPLQVGSTGIGGDQHAFTHALNALFGTKLKPIAGYPGTQEIMARSRARRA